MKKNKILSFLCATALISSSLLCGCSNSKATFSDTGVYFDTVINISLQGKDGDKEIEKCFQLAQKYEDLFSATKEGSDIYNINHNINSPVEVSDETIDLLKEGIKYCKESQGSFDITVGHLSNDLWHLSNNNGDIPSQNDIDNALTAIDYNNIVISDSTVMLKEDNAAIDLGAIAKGYIADEMKEMIIEDGYDTGIINLGGNVLVIGEKDSDEGYYNIGIQKPFEDGATIAGIKVKDKSVVTSGNYQRYFEKDGKIYHHILDLNTGYPCDNDLNSVTIISDKSIDGDALSTITFLKGLDEGKKYIDSLDGIEAIFITKDNEVIYTDGLKGFVTVN
ncbi:MAG: FAD:protein FMN transferase [Lachnospiraceae bacterium]|nr:FAD:protein FMN transferase [Lachnospiraceae bacterium]